MTAAGKPSVGQPISRVDARLKVTGKAEYAADVPVAHVAHAVIVTSGAHGTLTGLDVVAARKAPGVIAVITHAEVPRLPNAVKTDPKNPGQRVLQVFQDDHVPYSDTPIALVVAESIEAAQHAAGLVKATYELAPTLAEIDGALDRVVEPETAGPHGPTDSARGSVDRGLAGAHARVDATYSTPAVNHNPMEPHATTAVWQGDHHLTLYDATQGVFGVRDRIAAIFGLDKQNVRVIDRFVGGGFGCKGTPWSHVALAALAARMIDRPVKLVVTRPQMFSLVGHRPRTIQHISMAAGPEGRLTAIRHEVFSETSRFDTFVEPSALQTRMLYDCANVETSHRLVRIDVPTPTFQRAPGEATGTFALECAMDELAAALAMDPVALRLRNDTMIDLDAGKPFSSRSLRTCLERGAERFGWSQRQPKPRSMRDGRLLVGWGMAVATYPANARPSSAIARLLPDGTALVQAGTQDLGTGTYTIMTQIAADALGLPVEKIRFELGDTALPETPVSGGSMTAASTGTAVKAACEAVIDRAGRRAVLDRRSPLFGASAAELVTADGALTVRGSSSRRDSLAAIVARSGLPELSAEASTKDRPKQESYSTHGFGADFVEVTVDPDLGEVRVRRAVGAFGIGKLLNPKTGTSQLMGGMVWGIGMALHEHTVRDLRTARVVTRDLADYHVPVNADVPEIDVIVVDEVDPHVNELGAKGIGEIGITGMAAAIANAVWHATGVRVRDLPIRLEKIV